MAGKNEEIAIKIGAKDEASKVIDKLAKKIDGMEADEARIVLTADTRKLQDQLDRARIKLGTLTGDEYSVQARLVGTLEADVAEAKDMLDKLDGQTATVKIDTAGAKQGLDEVGKSADSSKSVLANMVGNATQDLGALGGVAGSAGVAIGQMGEYMADAAASGEGFKSILKNFAGVGLPIAGVSIALAGISKVMSSIAASKAFDTERAEAYAKAIESVGESSRAVLEVIKQTQGVTGRAGGLFGTRALDSTKDITKQLNDAKVSADDFAKAVEQGGAPLDQAVAKLEELRATAKAAYEIKPTDENAQALSNATAAIEILREEHQKYADQLNRDDTFAKFQANSISGKAATEAWTKVLDGGIDSLKGAESALDDTADAEKNAADKARLLADKVAAFNAQYDEMTGRIDASNAVLDLGDAFDAVTEAAGRTYLMLRDHNPEVEAQLREQARLQNDLKTKIIEYHDEIGRLPPEAITRINALIDEGDLKRAEEQLLILTRNRQANIRIIASGGAGYGPVAPGSGPRSVTPSPATAGVSSFGATATTTAVMSSSMMTVPEVVVPVRLKLPTSAEISRRIGPLSLAIAAGLRADERLTGIRD